MFPEEDAPLLKAWVVNRLEHTSDVDPDVLADYVLALLRHNTNVDGVRELLGSEIPDFLKEDPGAFVNELLETILHKLYVPGAQPPPKPQPFALPQTAYDARLPYEAGPMEGAAAASKRPTGTRKHGLNDLGDEEGHINEFGEWSRGGGRAPKRSRRGGGYGGRGGKGEDGGRQRNRTGNQKSDPFMSPFAGAAGLSTRPFGSVGFDALMMMAGAMPPPTNFSPPNGRGQKRRARCRDYDTKGYCSRGATCMFEHGDSSAGLGPVGSAGSLPGSQSAPQLGEEYDPSNPMFMFPDMHGQGFPLFAPPFNMESVFGGGGSGRHQEKIPRRRRRASFSADGGETDRSKTVLVVESIPEEYFTEEQIRGYFRQYGKIVDVSIQPYKRLAIVKFETWESANAAWKSPKVIFDNRFVKVFWYKNDQDKVPLSMHVNSAAAANSQTGDVSSVAPGESQMDMEDFARRQEEAQKIHEQKQRKLKEVQRQLKELEKKQKELLMKRNEETKKLYAKIAARSTKAGGEDNSHDEEETATPAKPKTQTEALKKQLAALEVEAMSLGLDPNDSETMSIGPSWTARGGWGGRGRGTGALYQSRGFALRGRGAFRGSYRGRGGYQPGSNHAMYAAYSLDLRSKTIRLAGVDFTPSNKDETLRQYLFGIGDFIDIRTNPNYTEVTFKDRRTAEQFIASIPEKTIPGIDGHVDLKWVNSTGVATPCTPPRVFRTLSRGNDYYGEQQQHKMAAADTVERCSIISGNESDKDVNIVLEGRPDDDDTGLDYDVADDGQWEE